MRGRVKFFKVEEDYGYIARADGERDLHFRQSAVESGYIPRADDEVDFELTTGARGLSPARVRKATPSGSTIQELQTDQRYRTPPPTIEPAASLPLINDTVSDQPLRST